MYMKADGCSRAVIKKWAKGYSAAAALCLITAAVYELFSHGVYSAYMLGAWTLPALCAVFLLVAAKSFDPLPGTFFSSCRPAELRLLRRVPL